MRDVPELTPAQYADNLRTRYEYFRKAAPKPHPLSIFLGAKASLLGRSSLSIPLRRSMLESYRIAEMQLFGKITDLPGEQTLLSEPLLYPLPDSSDSQLKHALLMSSNPTDANVEVEDANPTRERLHQLSSADALKDNAGVKIRRAAVIIVGAALGLAGTWLPWRNNPAHFLIFLGCGLIEVSGMKIPFSNEAHNLAMWLTMPEFFMSRRVSATVHILAFVAFVTQIIIAFAHHTWWSALLLWIPPFWVASTIFPGRNPSKPFFLGLLLVAAGCFLAAA